MKNNKYDAAIFDLDGTLLDTSEGILASVRYTIDYFGFSKVPEDIIKTFIGPPIQDSFAELYNLSGDILQKIATVFRNRYKDTDLYKAVPYDGIFELLNSLKEQGIKIAVATYKREDYAISLLKHFGFNDFFDVMHGGEHNNIMKKNDIIELCISEIGIVDKCRAVLIGDTQNDELGASKAKIDFIGVTYGFGYHDKKSKENAIAIGFADTTGDILKYFN